jgi:hypothetical protein
VGGFNAAFDATHEKYARAAARSGGYEGRVAMDADLRTKKHETPIVKNQIEAKQGTNRAPMLYVLLGGLALVVISFALMFLAR